VSQCHELRPLLGAYVLGALDPEEAAQVREHVASCQSCAAEHARLAPLPGLLTLAAGAEAAAAEPPPAALEERLLDAVARETTTHSRRRPRRRLLWGAGGLAAGAAAAAVVVVLAVGAGGSAGYDITLHPSAAAPRATAWATVHPVSGGTAMRLWVQGMPRDANVVYEVRCDSPNWSASAGTFRVGRDGKASVNLTTAARPGEYDWIHVVRRADHRVVFSAPIS
jgi:anti-sigma factor RsiW